METPDIFISYSNEHWELVTPLVKLLRLGDRPVFQDATSIEPGERWEGKILDALRLAKVVVVIWCAHADASKWVRQETDFALSLDKRIVPVRIDKTPLPESLSPFQAIDLSDSIDHASKGKQDAAFLINGSMIVFVLTILVLLACGLIRLVPLAPPKVGTIIYFPVVEPLGRIPLMIASVVLFLALILAAPLWLTYQVRVRRQGQKLSEAVAARLNA